MTQEVPIPAGEVATGEGENAGQRRMTMRREKRQRAEKEEREVSYQCDKQGRSKGGHWENRSQELRTKRRHWEHGAMKDRCIGLCIGAGT